MDELAKAANGFFSAGELVPKWGRMTFEPWMLLKTDCFVFNQAAPDLGLGAGQPTVQEVTVEMPAQRDSVLKSRYT